MSFQRFLNGGEGIFHSPIGHLSDIVPKSFLQSFQQSRRNGLTQAIDCESIFGIGVFPKKNKKFANWKKKKKMNISRALFLLDGCRYIFFILPHRFLQVFLQLFSLFLGSFSGMFQFCLQWPDLFSLITNQGRHLWHLWEQQFNWRRIQRNGNSRVSCSW